MRLLRHPQARSKRWYAEFRDPGGDQRRWALSVDRNTALADLAMIGRLVDSVRARARALPPDLAAWIVNQAPRRRRQLAAARLVDPTAAYAGAPLAESLKAYRQSLEARDRNHWHVSGTCTRIERALTGTGAMVIEEVDGEKIAAWLKLERTSGMSVATSNGYLTALRAFFRWMVDTDRAARAPRLPAKLPAAVDIRRDRRALTDAEIRRLLVTIKRRSIARYWLYRFALETGLRRGEIASLTPAHFTWGRSPCVAVQAAYSRKAKRDRRVPMRPDTARELRAWIGKRTGPVFAIPDRTSTVLQADLEAAGIAFLDSLKRRVDFHALRHTFATRAAKGMGFRALQAVLGHQSPAMTARYAHEAWDAVQDGIRAMPKVTA